MMQPWGQSHSQLLQGANQAGFKKGGIEGGECGARTGREKGVSGVHLQTCGEKS